MNLKSNQNVLLHAFADEDKLNTIYEIMSEISSLGCNPYYVLDSTVKMETLFKNGVRLNEHYLDYLEEMDVIIDIFFYVGPKISRSLCKEGIMAYQKYLQMFFVKASKKEKLIQIRVPSIDQANAANMEVDEFEKLMEASYDIDYKELEERCIKQKNEMERHSSYDLVSSNGDRLSMNLENRKWYLDCGEGDFPCGEIYIAPNEKSINGKVFFNELVLDSETQFSNLNLTIKNGVITDSNQKDFMDFLDTLPSNGNCICELGIGLNQAVKEMKGIPYLDEKMGNTMHLGLGANTMFGGNVTSPCHLDLVGFFSLEAK